MCTHTQTQTPHSQYTIFKGRFDFTRHYIAWRSVTSKQLYGFTKDKAYERSVWKRLWGSRNAELEGKHLSSLDYCSHATLLRLQPRAAAAWAAQLIPEHCSDPALPLSHLTGTTRTHRAGNLCVQWAVQIQSQHGHTEESLCLLPGALQWEGVRWGTKSLQIGRSFSCLCDLLRW